MSNSSTVIVVVEADLKNKIRTVVSEELEKLEKRLFERKVEQTAFGDRFTSRTFTTSAV